MQPEPLSAHRLCIELGWLLGRSLFPLVALVLLVGTLWWGPWGTLALAFLWWRLVTRFA